MRWAEGNQSPIRAFGADASRSVRDALDEIHVATDGRIGVRTAMEAAEAAGLAAGPRGALSEALAGVVGLRQLSRAAADAAKNGTKLTGRSQSLWRKMAGRAGIGAARQAVMGGNVVRSAMGGAAGALGGHLVGAALGLAGNLAGSVGKARDAVIKAGAALLGGRGSRAVAAVPVLAKYSYDGSEPTEDVAVRVQQLQALQ